MQGQLYCLSGVYAGESFPLSAAPVVIGRNPAVANIILPANDLQYSGKHAAVWFDENQKICYVQDFSSNGIFKASGERLPSGQISMLHAGEQFWLANSSCMFEFRLAQEVVHEEIQQAMSRFEDGINVVMGNTAQQAEVGYAKYAGFWQRAGAALIDGFIVCVITFVLDFFIFPIADIGISDPEKFGTILGWVYFALMESSVKQGTLGKIAVGIKVTDLYGNRITLLRAAGRYFAKYISAFILCIGFLFVFFTKRKQALHDLIAGCVVLEKS